MGHEKFNKIASGIQALVLSAGMIVGGIWTLYTFGSLKQIGKAKTELEQMRRSLRERGILNVTLQPSQFKDSKSSRLYVLVKVSIQNTGNRTEVIDWNKSGLYASRVDIDGKRRLAFGAASKADYLTPWGAVPSSSILPGQTRTLPFLIPAKEAGIYHLLFRASVSPVEAPAHMKEYLSAGIAVREFVWQASTYFNVK